MLIRVEHLNKTYHTGKVEKKVLKDIGFCVEEGEFVAIMGRSGCGKSTLLNLLGGMDRFDSGQYLFDGTNIAELKKKELAVFRNQKVGYVFQSFYLLKELNVAQNVALALGYAGVSTAKRNMRAMELLEMVGLQDKGKCRPSTLSGGEKQRVAIARAIANQPRVLLADEPTGSLDEETGKTILQLLQKLNGDGMTIIMVTHDPEIAAGTGRTLHMKDGAFVANCDIPSDEKKECHNSDSYMKMDKSDSYQRV